MMNNCTHKDENGNSTLIFSDKWRGVHPRVYDGICTICHETFRLSKEEYNKIKNSK